MAGNRKRTTGKQPSDADRLIYLFKKTPSAEIRGQLREFNSVEFVDVRTWVRNKVGGTWAPTRAGVTIRVELLPELKALVDALYKTAKPTDVNGEER